MQKLTINEELKNLLPPLSAEEIAGLEKSILIDGCLSPLIVWNNMLIDGHHRYEICKKHQIPFSTKSIGFLSLDDAKHWIWKHQENRRNLTPYHRAEIALKLKDAIAAKAKERQGHEASQPATTKPRQTDTRQVLADIAGVGTRTFDKVVYIAEHGDEKTKQKLRQGEKGTSIDKEYNRIREARNSTPANSAKQKPGILSEDAIRISKNTTPDMLAIWFVTNLPLEYLRQFTNALTLEVLYRCTCK